MGLIENVIDLASDAFRFKDTVIYKKNSDLQNRYDALVKLNIDYPNNGNIRNEMNIIKKGLEGENEIEYQLKKSHIGMYVLRDIKVKYEELTAQIDYIIITPVYIYYVECKNLTGNIIVNNKGDFIREYTVNGKKVKKGMYSPIRQVEAQREVIRKIWERDTSKIKKFFASKNFDYYRRILVVVANKDTILNTDHAPSDVKYRVLRSDSLLRQIEYDLKHRKKDEYLSSKKEMEEIAKGYISYSVNEEINYYEYYKNLFLKEKENLNEIIKKKLIDLRKKRSNEMKIPAYYVFNNEELDKLIEIKPKTIQELKEANILSEVKIKTHGEYIIKEFNENN